MIELDSITSLATLGGLYLFDFDLDLDIRGSIKGHLGTRVKEANFHEWLQVPT